MSGASTAGRRWLVGGLVATWVVVPPALMVARWPSWWTWIASEETPMTWLQSVVLVLAAAAAALSAHVVGLAGAGRRRTWALLAAGFAALAVDERFALHERIRDGVLAPRDISIPILPWVAPGDFLVMGLAVVGLALLPSAWRALGDDRAARTALVAGVALAAVAVGADSIDPSTWSVGAERVQQTGEEVVELASGLALLGAVALHLVGVLETRLAPRPEPAA